MQAILATRFQAVGNGEALERIVATNRGFSLYGFGKNERANIDRDELRFFQEVAKELVGLDAVQITAALSAGEIVEICYGNEEAQEPYSRRNA